MAEYLSALRAILPASERERLEKLLAVGPAEEAGLTDEQIVQILETIQKGELSFKLRLQGEQTDSISFNACLREILADLSLLYQQSQQAGQALASHGALQAGLAEQLEKGIARIERRIEDISVLADNQYSHVVTEAFLDTSMAELMREGNEVLFTDARGNPVEKLARIHGQELTLAISSQHDLLRDQNGETTATVEVLQQSGLAYRDVNPLYGPEAALDGSPDTFWSEAILSPSVLRLPTAGVDSGAITQLRINFSSPALLSALRIDPVAVYPMELVSLSAVVGEGQLVPIITHNPDKPRLIHKDTTWRFPALSAKGIVLTLRQIHADRLIYTLTKQAAASRELWQKLVAAERGAVQASIFDDLPEEALKRLEEEGELDPVWQAYLEVAEKYASDKSKHDALYMLGGITLLALLGGASVPYLLAALGLWHETHPQEPEKPEIIQVERYFYLYGARRIDCLGMTYAPSSIYVSKPFELEGNVREISLEAEEEHPVIVDSHGNPINRYGFNDNGELVSLGTPLRRTSVEYYVAPVAGDEVYEWIPILPLGQREVQSEFLQMSFGGTVVASVANGEPFALTRFAVDVDQPHQLYRDGQPVVPEYWHVAPSPDGKGSVVVIDRRLFSATSVYTMDYYPAGTPHVVRLDNGHVQPRQHVEYFEGAERNGRLVLTYTPYIDRERLLEDERKNQLTYNPVRITLNPYDHPRRNPEIHRIMGATKAITDPIYSTRDPNSRLSDPARLLNVTRYDSFDQPLLKPYHPLDQPPTFEYFHDGRIVYLPESFRHSSIENPSSHGQAIIEVAYEYLVSGVMVKIILRRSPVDPSLTPVVRRYSLRFRSLTQ